MFAATVINFLCASLNTGIEVARFIVIIQKVLIADIDYPLSEKLELRLLDKVLQNMNLVIAWTQMFPVSIKLLLSDPVSIHAG